MSGPKRQSLREKLERHTVKSDAGCWAWRGSKHPFGYGWVRHGSQTLVAHRVAYAEYIGPVPEGLVVRHSCDNPECTNPAHLVVGTHADNVADKVAKGRQHRGELHPSAKLSDNEVLKLREFRASGLSFAAIGRHFGVTRSGARTAFLRRQPSHP